MTEQGVDSNRPLHQILSDLTTLPPADSPEGQRIIKGVVDKMRRERDEEPEKLQRIIEEDRDLLEAEGASTEAQSSNPD